SDINAGTLAFARIPTGTTSSTVAVGNDSRINNGQTAYGWGNHASAGYATTSALTSGLATKQNTLTAGANVSISGNTISATNTTYTAGNGLTLSGTSFSLPVTQANTGSDWDGKVVTGVTQTTNGITVARGTLPPAQSQDVVYNVNSTTATALNVSSESVFTRSISSSTSYTFTGLPASGQAKYFQVIVTNTSGSAVSANFPSNINVPLGQTTTIPASSTAVFTFAVIGSTGGYLSKTI